MQIAVAAVVAAVLLGTAGSPASLAASASSETLPLVSGEEETDVVRLAFTGDTLIHVPVARSAQVESDVYDFRPMFADLKKVLGMADLSICHLEVPLSPENIVAGYPIFSAPGDLAEALVYAGFDGCSTASNHSFDRGVDGVIETMEILEEAGLAQSGMAREPTSGWEAAYYELGDLTVAHIASTYWLNGFRLPTDQPWLVQALDVDQILGIAARAKRSGADLVVASVHCCVEYVHEPTLAQRELHHDLIRSPDVDLVVAHHSHVVGPIEELDGEYIIHGLGNLLSAQRGGGRDDGLVAIVEAKRSAHGWVISGIEVVATWVEPGTYRILPAILYNPGSYGRTMSMVESYGMEVSHAVWPGFPGWRLPRV